MTKQITFFNIIVLLLVNLFYASISVVSKFTSQQEQMSLCFFIGLAVILGMLGIYAILWQQILKRIELTTAFMFKGSSLIFILLFSALIFGEQITLNNISGAILIIGGIVLFVKS